MLSSDLMAEVPTLLALYALTAAAVGAACAGLLAVDLGVEPFPLTAVGSLLGALLAVEDADRMS